MVCYNIMLRACSSKNSSGGYWLLCFHRYYSRAATLYLSKYGSFVYKAVISCHELMHDVISSDVVRENFSCLRIKYDCLRATTLVWDVVVELY